MSIAGIPDGSIRPEASAAGGAIRHPSALLEAEEPYLVSWGLREAILVSLATTILVLIAGILARSSSLWLLLIVPALAAGALGVLFFRNPPRSIPSDPGLLVAPADGTVVEVSQGEETEFIGGPALKVGIFLSVFDVHLNRTPCSGRVEYLRHRGGSFLDARNPAASVQNECQAVGILRSEPGGPEGVRVLVRQIAGAIARRIICPLREGDEVERGRLIGMIKFGSRTEIFVSAGPEGALPEVLVKKGDKVQAGRTAVLRFPPAASAGIR